MLKLKTYLRRKRTLSTTDIQSGKGFSIESQLRLLAIALTGYQKSIAHISSYIRYYTSMSEPAFQKTENRDIQILYK